MSLYTGLQATADRLLAQFGAAATLTRTAPAGAYDPATGAQATADTVQTVRAVVLPYGDSYTKDTTILASDRKALISAAGVSAPQAGDVLTWGAEVLTVIKTKITAPGQVAVLYECQVRNG